MPRNGSGTYTLPKPAFVPNTTISSADVNSDFSDIATALTGSIASDGQTSLTGAIKNISGTVLLPGISFAADPTTGIYYPGANQVAFGAGAVGAILCDTTKIGTGQDGSILKYVNGAVLIPVGILSSYGGSSAPSGWLLCYGQAVSRTGYPELFFVLGTTYGSGDGVTTFNLPDLRGRTSYGKDNMGGSTAGRITNAGSGVVGTTLGAAGGVQNITISQANLPNVSFALTLNDTRTWKINGLALGALTGTGIAAPAGSNWSFVAEPTVVVSGGSLSGTAASGGSGTAAITLSPGIILNTIIFAGRP